MKIFPLYKIFTASDFVYELKKNIFKCNHSVQLFITEFDLLALSNEIIELLPTERSIDIVISSVNQKKSLRLVNLSIELFNLAELYIGMKIMTYIKTLFIL